MQWILILAIVVAVALVATLAILLLQSKKPKEEPVDVSSMVAILQNENIKAIRFVRNKIVVDFLNIDFFDPEALKDTGVKGITIVGDTVKFYVDGGPERNEQVFKQLQKELER